MKKIIESKLIWVIIIILFAVLMIFLDRYNLIDKAKLNRQINELESQKEYYQDKIEEDSTTIARIKNDDEYLEKYAREHYLMKRKDDFVYVITQK